MRLGRPDHASGETLFKYTVGTKVIFFVSAGCLLCLFGMATTMNSSIYFSSPRDESIAGSTMPLTNDHAKKMSTETYAIRPPGPSYGQQLSLDLSDVDIVSCFDPIFMEEATLKIADLAGFKIVDIQKSQAFKTSGVSIVAMLEDGHMTVRTWPEHEMAIIDITARDINIDFQQALHFIAQEYGGDLSNSIYSIKPRGNYQDALQGESDDDEEESYEESYEEVDEEVDEGSYDAEEESYEVVYSQEQKLHQQFKPFEIMGQHKFKQKIFEKYSPYQHIAIYDHHHIAENTFSTASPTRSLFLDGVMQSSVDDEKKYHQSLVHPAFVASSVPVKRVLIIGGGEGGTLREVLKWKSVEKVTMVDLDADVVAASRTYLNSFSDCTGFGTVDCFNDPRVELFNENYITWQSKHLGREICEKRNLKGKELDYDVVLIDLVDIEGLSEDKKWAKNLYTENFFQRIACSLNTFGVLAANFGEAPEFHNDQLKSSSEKIVRNYEKIRQIQSMTRVFRHSRVYDSHMESSASLMAFAIGIIPHRPWEKRILKELKDHGNVGINDFDGTPARVNLKLRRGLAKNAYPLRFYDGAVQHGFQYPAADWTGVYCKSANHQKICNISKHVFTEDYEEDWFKPHLTPNADGQSGFVAKKDIRKGHVSGLWDAATAFNIPATDLERLKTFAGGNSQKYKELYDFLYIYGHDGGQGATGSDFYCSSLSLHTFANHDCDHNPNFAGLASVKSWSAELWMQWNPVGTRIMKELDHVTIATRDIAKGEMITDDYSDWDGFAHAKGDQLKGHAQFKEWCGKN